MRSKILLGLWVAAVSLLFSVPAYAYTGTTNGGNGGLGNGMGTSSHGIHDGISANQVGTKTYIHSTNGSAASTTGTSNHEVSVYGTGTGSQFLNVNPNANLNANLNANTPITTDHNSGYRTQSYANDGYRALDTTSSRNKGWGWLGLLGLLGLFGMRSRNPQHDR
ncbi:WGxxGxxG family protein [Paenibacillus kobensis]|uniref:WGxxGxxG family protein n=1 Tax=Paenibacillus kobensis TaxID=59841 RepID=UPI000FD6F853|nr:WGxxGxxG family protein [Paenibacillus kobensis]